MKRPEFPVACLVHFLQQWSRLIIGELVGEPYLTRFLYYLLMKPECHELNTRFR